MNTTAVRLCTIGRSRGDSISAMMVCAIGNRPPPPTPCNARSTTKSQIVGASAQAMEPTIKMPIAASMMVRRPWISASLPNSGVAAVAPRR